ncbi:MAG TPA: hypothetical protein VFU48_05525 [Nitrospira sp.]|nr:hypothetical protein [Nitrospira sp.]
MARDQDFGDWSRKDLTQYVDCVKDVRGNQAREDDQVVDPRNYIDKIRNPLKRSYAASYYDYLRNGGDEPTRPEGLSYMAAQAVRLELGSLYRQLLSPSNHS